MGHSRAAPALKQRIFEVLVVDDEVALQEVFSELLVDMCCRVQGASNGSLALQLLERQDFDLIICDLKMPSMDGRRFFSRVREIKPHLARNFVFITGDTNSPKTIEFLQQSGNRWITKPFNFREVQEIFSNHLAHTQKTGSVKRSDDVTTPASS
jgi:CheY-like chemotaxis protein